MLESRVSSFSKLAALQGKLNLLIGQAAQEEGGVTQSLLNVPVTTITLGGEVDMHVFQVSYQVIFQIPVCLKT